MDRYKEISECASGKINDVLHINHIINNVNNHVSKMQNEIQSARGPLSLSIKGLTELKTKSNMAKNK